MVQLNSSAHIEIRNSARGDRPFVAGHRVRVQDIVFWNEEGLTADDIVCRVPTPSLADAHTALAYYFDNREEIDRQSARTTNPLARSETAQTMVGLVRYVNTCPTCLTSRAQLAPAALSQGPTLDEMYVHTGDCVQIELRAIAHFKCLLWRRESFEFSVVGGIAAAMIDICASQHAIEPGADILHISQRRVLP